LVVDEFPIRFCLPYEKYAHTVICCIMQRWYYGFSVRYWYKAGNHETNVRYERGADVSLLTAEGFSTLNITSLLRIIAHKFIKSETYMEMKAL